MIRQAPGQIYQTAVNTATPVVQTVASVPGRVRTSVVDTATSTVQSIRAARSQKHWHRDPLRGVNFDEPTCAVVVPVSHSSRKHREGNTLRDTCRNTSESPGDCNA